MSKPAQKAGGQPPPRNEPTARPVAAPPTDYPELRRLLGALSPRRLLRAVFVDQLRLRRAGASLKIELAAQDRPPGAPAARPGTAAERAAAGEGPAQAMTRALGALLDGSPDSRAVLKHLAALEHHLATHERPFFGELTLPTLQLMLRQLHGLVTPPPAPGVALLIAALTDALEQKTADMAATQPGVQPISSFFVDEKMEVKELNAAELAVLGEMVRGRAEVARCADDAAPAQATSVTQTMPLR